MPLTKFLQCPLIPPLILWSNYFIQKHLLQCHASAVWYIQEHMNKNDPNLLESPGE